MPHCKGAGHAWNWMSPPSSCTAGRIRVSSSSLIMATTSLSSSWMAVLDVEAAVSASVNSGSPANALDSEGKACRWECLHHPRRKRHMQPTQMSISSHTLDMTATGAASRHASAKHTEPYQEIPKCRV